MLHLIIPLAVKLSLVGLVLAVGMDAKLSELLSLFRRPVELLKAVLAVDVVVPIAAACLIGLFPLTPVVKLGILVMAVSPVPPLVPGKQLKAGGEKGYAFSLYTALVLLSIVTVPVTMAVLANIYGRSVELGPLDVASKVVKSVILPLLAGVIFHRFAPAIAERLSPLVRKGAMLLLVVVVIPLVIMIWPAMQALIGNGTVLAMALTAAIALAAGHLLGGPTMGDRGALALTAATRHPGIALMVAKSVDDDKRVTAAILLFMLVGIVVAIPYQMWLKRQVAGMGGVARTMGVAPRAQ